MIHARQSVFAAALAAGILHVSAHPGAQAPAAGVPLDPRIETLAAPRTDGL
jgi:hypothetical protein